MCWVVSLCEQCLEKKERRKNICTVSQPDSLCKISCKYHGNKIRVRKIPRSFPNFNNWKNPTTFFQPDGDTITERTNKAMEVSICKRLNYHQREWPNYVHLLLKAHCSSVYAATYYILSHVLLGTSWRLSSDCRYELHKNFFRHQTISYPIPKENCGEHIVGRKLILITVLMVLHTVNESNFVFSFKSGKNGNQGNSILFTGEPNQMSKLLGMGFFCVCQ